MYPAIAALLLKGQSLYPFLHGSLTLSGSTNFASQLMENPDKATWLQRLVDNLPVVIFEYTFFPDGRRDFTYVSPRCKELIGIEPEVLLRGHLSMASFIHPDEFPSFWKSVEESVVALSDWKWEGRVRGLRGYFWVEANGVPVRMNDGRVVYSGVFSDITDKKKLEFQHSESERRYKDLVEELPLGIVIHAGGKIRFANKAAAHMIGAADPSQLIGMDIIRFVHPSYRSLIQERIDKIMRGELAAVTEERFIKLDGTEIDVESIGSPYLFEGEPAVQVVVSDITERKRAELSYRRTETLLYQLFQNTPMAIVLLNQEGQVVQINKGFEELFQFSLEDLRGRALNESIIPPEFLGEDNDINSLITENRVIRVETVRRRRDGKKLSVIIYGVPVTLQDQKLGIFGMYVDITDRKRVEEELKVRNAELDNFVYKVSHDLRAPLSSVLGLAHLATLPGNTDNLLDYIKLMGEKATQLDHFISDVLSHSKNLKMELKIESVDFRHIIEKAIGNLSYLAGADQLRKEVSISDGTFFSDPWRVGEIIRNLVSNAIKYRKLDNGEIRISIDIVIDTAQCVISFSDNGIGIDPENLPRIFEMFYRASGQSEGSGLGLYIVKNAVEKLGGTIQVDSEPGLGTTFTMRLPQQSLAK